MQTQTSNALHNAIMEAGSKDRPPMLAPGNYVQWKSRIKRYIDTKPNHELIHYCLQNPPYKYQWVDKEVLVTKGSPVTTTESYMQNYKNVSQDIRDQLSAEVEAVYIILAGIDKDIHSTVDACPNACEMWKAIERLKQSESINVQDLKTNLYWEFGKVTSRDGESLESYYSRFYKMMNELFRNQCDVTNHQSQELKTVSYHKLYDILKHHQNEVNEIRAERLARKAIINSPLPIYDQEPYVVAEDDEIANQDNFPRFDRGTGYDNQRIGNVDGARENVGTPVVQKSRIQCYNCKECRHVARECHKPKRAKDAAYHKEKMLLCKQEEAGFWLNAKQANWKDDTDDESEDQELEAHYMYMAKLQEVTPDAADKFGPIFDTEPVQQVQTNDNYNAFAIESEHPEQSQSIHDTYLIKQDEHNVIIDSLVMSYDREQIDQNDDADDLDNERDLLASLIEKLKCEIDDSKNRNKFLDTSKKDLVDKLKGEIEDFKTENKSSESSNNRFKGANNKLSETNKLMYTDLKKFQAELDRRNDVKYASKMETNCAKAKGDLISYKMESEKSFTKYTLTVNDLNQTISEIKKELFAHQENISILTQQKEVQIKLYKSRKDKEIDKVIALENKVKELSKSKTMSKSFETLQKHAINLELELQQCKEKIKNDKSFKVNQSKEFCKEREQYSEIQDLKVQLQDKSIAIGELKKLIETLKGKSVDTKFGKSSVVQQPNAFKSQKPSILGKPTVFSDSLKKKDFSKSNSVTKKNVSNDFLKPVTA
nr:hypothetical protein [Tanacetum cinerariifolium]